MALPVVVAMRTQGYSRFLYFRIYRLECYVLVTVLTFDSYYLLQGLSFFEYGVLL